MCFNMVPEEGLEPPLLSEADFESAASTDSTTRANIGAPGEIRTLTPLGNGF